MGQPTGGITIYHKLQFRATARFDLQVPGKARLEQLRIEKGEVLQAEVRPYVQETEAGPVEVADLHLPGDGTILTVPMKSFRFV